MACVGLIVKRNSLYPIAALFLLYIHFLLYYPGENRMCGDNVFLGLNTYYLLVVLFFNVVSCWLQGQKGEGGCPDP